MELSSAWEAVSTSATHEFNIILWYSKVRKKKVVGLERGPLSLVSTIEELLDRKVAAPV
jgi:hypothetical protein